jgi:hypothetical protein
VSKKLSPAVMADIRADDASDIGFFVDVAMDKISAQAPNVKHFLEMFEHYRALGRECYRRALHFKKLAEEVGVDEN